MQDKQKVTLYLRPDLHRQLKIQAAVDSEPMSEIAERAIGFYLDHQDIVEELESAAQGSTHRVFNCPECANPVVLRSGEIVSLRHQPSVLLEEEVGLKSLTSEELVGAGA
jgi:hypothetical protein